MYVLSPSIPEAIASRFQGLYTLILNKYYVDELYDATIVDPVIGGSSSVLWKVVDVGVIDRIVNGVGSEARGMGMILRMLQSGNIRNYATWVVFGSVLLVAAIAAGVTGGIR
jgi:NADH-quinone oxidoreductase subunit L